MDPIRSGLVQLRSNVVGFSSHVYVNLSVRVWTGRKGFFAYFCLDSRRAAIRGRWCSSTETMKWCSSRDVLRQGECGDGIASCNGKLLQFFSFLGLNIWRLDHNGEDSWWRGLTSPRVAPGSQQRWCMLLLSSLLYSFFPYFLEPFLGFPMGHLDAV